MSAIVEVDYLTITISPYIRDVVDANGDTIDRQFYCSKWCWQDSHETEPPASADGVEAGGFWPIYEISAEWLPVQCEKCGDECH